MSAYPIYERLRGIQAILLGVHQASTSLSTASKGYERQQFIESFLSQVLPPQFRFGTGEAIDSSGARTGQLDVVVEYPFVPSVPIPGQPGSRLYLAEGIAAVIEVKSDASDQWQDVICQANRLSHLRRHFEGGLRFMESNAFWKRLESIPFFIVAYSGWRRVQTVASHLNDAIQGILIIDPGIFVSSCAYDLKPLEGPWSLWGLVSCLHKCTRSLLAVKVDLGAYTSLWGGRDAAA